MRRRLALLVTATTSVVLLAFVLPLGLLVSRAASSNAISDATSRSQVLVSRVASGGGCPDVLDLARLLDLPGMRVTCAEDVTARSPRASTVTRTGSGDALVQQPVFDGARTVLITTRVTAARLHRGVLRAWLVLGALGLVLVGLSLVVADRLARTMTQPISELALTAERLGHGDMTARVQPAGPDEVREVGIALNTLAARIEELLAREREAVADLSHRLRTPITALRLDADALRDGDDRARLGADVDNLSRQIDALIREARRPVREGVEARCDARAVVAERVAFWEALAEDQGRVVHLALPPGPCEVRSTSSDLAAALDALLGNVIAHTSDGTPFAVSLEPLPDGGGLVVVADSGQGFADDDVVRRGESRAGSTGLGLDIARRTATASGGDVRLGSTPGGGARVSLRLGPPVS
ncbi:MAG: sensor histidine kinase [Actinomycetes bacterium]